MRAPWAHIGAETRRPRRSDSRCQAVTVPKWR